MAGIYEALERSAETRDRLTRFRPKSSLPEMQSEGDVQGAVLAQPLEPELPSQPQPGPLSESPASAQAAPQEIAVQIDPKTFLPSWMWEQPALAPNVTQNITVNPTTHAASQSMATEGGQQSASEPSAPLSAQLRLGLFDSMEVNPTASLLSKSETFMGKRMVGLYQNIRAALRRSKPRVPAEILANSVMFMGATYGEGAATQMRDFAKAVASKFRLKILLVDADCSRAPQAGFFKVQHDKGLDMIVRSNQDVSEMLVDSCNSLFHQVADSSLILCQVTTDGATASSTFDSPRLVRILNQMRHEVDLILISGPPVHLSPDGVSLSSEVDGIVLVVAAESKRWQVANSAKVRLQENGGNVLGVILNKQQRHIPDFIYKRL